MDTDTDIRTTNPVSTQTPAEVLLILANVFDGDAGGVGDLRTVLIPKLQRSSSSSGGSGGGGNMDTDTDIRTTNPVSTQTPAEVLLVLANVFDGDAGSVDGATAVAHADAVADVRVVKVKGDMHDFAIHPPNRGSVSDSQPHPYTSFIACMFNYPILNGIISETYSLKTLKSLSILLKDEAAATGDNQTVQRMIRKRYLMILHLAKTLFRTHHYGHSDVAESCHICGHSDEIDKYHYSEHLASVLYNNDNNTTNMDITHSCALCGFRLGVRVRTDNVRLELKAQRDSSPSP
jgi:hypothetical protein